MNPWAILFDGLTEPRNPGGVMAWGWVLETDGGVESGKGSKPAEPANTNNVAEYMALYFALARAAELRAASAPEAYPGLFIRGDSQLVCRQIDGQWNVNNPRLAKAVAACHELLRKLTPWDIQWIPREQNEQADELSRLAYFDATGKPAPERGGKARAGR